MKKVLLLVMFLFFTVSLQAQFEDRFNELSEDLQKGYSTPLATWTGTYLKFRWLLFGKCFQAFWF